jgi:membrane protein
LAIRAVFFDIDGTLVDSNDMHVLAWQEAFGSIGVSFDHQAIHDQIGKGADMLVPALLPDADKAVAEELDHYLDVLGARDLVGATTSGDDVENTKPAPDIFETALQKVAPLKANEVMVVGDTPYDVEAAAKCGISAIAVRSGKFSDDQLLRTNPMAIYDDAAALLAGLDRSPLGRLRGG